VLWIVVGVAVFVGFTVLAWPLLGGYMAGMMGMMGFGWGFMALIPLTVVGLVVLGVYYIASEFTDNRFPPDGVNDAIETLNERYARGEISREQYLKMKGDVHASR
jgi:putative membrane protein